ncbi:hypothetical protein V8F20_004051 [Naviculisporaceae sp. PSN 640]
MLLQQAYATTTTLKSQSGPWPRRSRSPSSSSAHEEPHPDYLNTTITQFKLREWGFVIVRTTYSSDTKWAEFISILNENVRHWFTVHNHQHLSHLLPKHVFTVIQDPAKLNKANLGVTAQVFHDWVHSPQAKAEREGTVFTENWIYSPRYDFYVLADERTVNQIVRLHTIRQPLPPSDAIFRYDFLFNVKIVHAQQVEAYRQAGDSWEGWPEEHRHGNGINDNREVIEEEVDGDDIEDLVKRVKIFEIVDLYAVLANDLDMWFNLYSPRGVIVNV